MKKLFAGIIIAAIAVTMQLSAYADTYGYCGKITEEYPEGENLTWYVDESESTITISGTGEMADYESADDVPWIYSRANYIRRIIVEDGVTSIGVNAFRYVTNISELSLPHSLVYINDYAFADSSYTNGNSNLTLPAVEYIGASAFENCTGYQHFVLSEGVHQIGERAFYNCLSLKCITIPSTVTSLGTDFLKQCNSLSYIIMYNTDLEITDDYFYGSNNNLYTVYGYADSRIADYCSVTYTDQNKNSLIKFCVIPYVDVQPGEYVSGNGAIYFLNTISGDLRYVEPEDVIVTLGRDNGIQVDVTENWWALNFGAESQNEINGDVQFYTAVYYVDDSVVNNPDYAGYEIIETTSIHFAGCSVESCGGTVYDLDRYVFNPVSE